MGWDGFDSVELIMGIEDNLCINIPDKDAERLCTPGDLLNYLENRVDAIAAPTTFVCRSASIFYKGRAALAGWAGLDARWITPSTSTGIFFPPHKERKLRNDRWKQLQTVLGIDLGKMRPPTALERLFNVMLWATLIGALAIPAVVPTDSIVFAVKLFFTVIFLVQISIWVFGKMIANEIPAQCQTVGELISCVRLGQIQDAPRLVSGRWTHPELWELIQDLTAASAGISPASVCRNMQFIRL